MAFQITFAKGQNVGNLKYIYFQISESSIDVIIIIINYYLSTKTIQNGVRRLRDESGKKTFWSNPSYLNHLFVISLYWLFIKFAISGLFFLYFRLFYSVNTNKCYSYKLLLAEFEPGSSGVGSDRSANTTALCWLFKVKCSLKSTMVKCLLNR